MTNKQLHTIVKPEMAFKYQILPLSLDKNVLRVAIAGNNGNKVKNELRFQTGLQIKTCEESIEKVISGLKNLYPDYVHSTSENSNSNSTLFQNGSSYSTIEFVNQIISSAIKAKVSDIHLERFEKSFRLRYRMDGKLQEIMQIPYSKHAEIISRLKILANLDIAEKRRPQDGKIRFSHQDNKIDIRVSSLPTVSGEKMVLRILDKSNVNLDINNLGLSENQKKLIKSIISQPYGMILVTGPTGSGKTTTLYSLLTELNSIEKNILTIEDPVEYNLQGINQSNVKNDIGYNFASALRTFLRQDPDIIMVGEIRDRETAEIAIRASLTGHLVLSTLHTNDAASAITRLIDMGIEPFLVAASLKMIIAQRLVRKLCDCKVKVSDDYYGELFKGETLFKTKGCEYCSNIGYKGRTALYEIISIEDELANIIGNNKPLSEIKAHLMLQNHQNLKEAGKKKVLEGITTYEEVLRETV